jgi:uncharacterized membrane protein
MLAGAEDNLEAEVPPWLKMANSIALFPVRLIEGATPPSGYSDREIAHLFFLEMVVNSLFWGFLLTLLLVTLYRLWAKMKH